MAVTRSQPSSGAGTPADPPAGGGPGTVLVDQHCHLPGDPDEAARVVAEARAAGVRHIIDVGTDVDTSRAAVERARRLEGVHATAGVHPHEARHGLDGLAELVATAGVVAVGECGLDYHYDHSPRPVQRTVFAAQIALAHDHGLPLVIHTREAWEDTFAVLDTEGVPAITVFHCFTGGPGEAEACLARGAHLSFSGIVSFARADEVREAARRCPPDRLLAETDAPYLAPVPHRGRPNRPAWVRHVVEALAAARGEPFEQVAALTAANAVRCYGLTDQ